MGMTTTRRWRMYYLPSRQRSCWGADEENDTPFIDGFGLGYQKQ